MKIWEDGWSIREAVLPVRRLPGGFQVRTRQRTVELPRSFGLAALPELAAGGAKPNTPVSVTRGTTRKSWQRPRPSEALASQVLHRVRCRARPAERVVCSERCRDRRTRSCIRRRWLRSSGGSEAAAGVAGGWGRRPDGCRSAGFRPVFLRSPGRRKGGPGEGVCRTALADDRGQVRLQRRLRLRSQATGVRNRLIG